MLGNGFGFNLGLGLDAGSKTSYQVDSAYTFESAGEAMCLRFVATESQTSGTLDVYFYCSATTGSPTFSAEVRNGPGAADDPDRPEAAGSTLATVSSIIPTANTWSACSFTGVSLTKGQQYYVVLYNAHGTPASNYASWVYRGALDSQDGSDTALAHFQVGYTTDGFSTDALGTGTTQVGTAVLAYDSGTVVGNPYVDVEALSFNANDRGNRIRFTEKINVLAFYGPFLTSNLTAFKIYQGASETASVTADRFASQRAGFGAFGSVELAKATDYDFVVTMSGSTAAGTLYTMGEAEGSLPADVLAARPGGVLAYVTGTTPGSYTADTSKIIRCNIFFNDQVAVTGGGNQGISQGLHTIDSGVIA